MSIFLYTCQQERSRTRCWGPDFINSIHKSFKCIIMERVENSPVGYGRNTTGGGNGSVVTVSTVAGLKAALTALGSSRIIVTQNLTFAQGDIIKEVVTNKTLLGVRGIRLISTARVKDGGILQLDAGSNNVIIRNLIFEGPGAYDADGNDLLQNLGCTNLWVDHCAFYDGVDGNFDNTNFADNVTISWCKFGYNIPPLAGGPGGSDDHRFSNLIGSKSDNAPADGHFSITFQCCYWAEGCKERMPRARNAELHILNCLYDTSVSGSVALGLEGGPNGTNCYVEGTYFKRITNVYKSYGTGTQNLTFVDCIGGVSNIGSAPRPSYPYTALAVGAVEAAVTANAGATLSVGTDGSIS
jgi:pectate lyase